MRAFPVAEGTIFVPLAARAEAVGHGLKWNAAHNSFVEIGAELGIPGLLVFLALLICTYRSAMRVAYDALARPPGCRGHGGTR